MFVRWLLSFVGVVVAGILLTACGGASAPQDAVTPESMVTETPDLVATEVAVKRAAAATLTAEALAAQPVETQVTPEPVEEPATETPVPTPSPTPAQTAGDSVDVQPTDTPVPAGCTVVSNGLNLRPGPAVIYDPPLRTLPQNAAVVPLARLEDNTWIQVQAVDSSEIGWVAADATFLACNIDISGLPLGEIPPTPTPTPTDVPAPPKRVRVPVDGGQSDLQGQIAIPGFSEDELKGPNSNVTFRDRLVFQVEVFDPGANKGNHDGAGIREVNIQIFDSDGKVHERTERTAGYCVFGGGEPDCNVFNLRDNDRWPETNQRINNDSHSVRILITTESGQEEQWNWSFEIDR